MDDDNYATMLESFDSTSLLQVAKVKTEKVSGLYHLVLRQKWGISPKKAFNMICHTTQPGFCNVLHLSLSRRFRTNDCQLQYRILPHNVYSDTLFGTTVSRRGNMCGWTLAPDFGWSCLFTMKLKSEAHEALPLFSQWDWVPPAVIFDNAKEMILGEFNRKLRETLCHLKQTKPFTSWQNAAKREIMELKKSSGRKLIKFGAPKRHWNDCLELESYIRSNTTHGIYKLDEEVPETDMSSKTSDISQYTEFEWFKWVMFWDEISPHHNDHFRLGRYLGPSIYICPTLMAKIIEENGTQEE